MEELRSDLLVEAVLAHHLEGSRDDLSLADALRRAGVPHDEIREAIGLALWRIESLDRVVSSDDEGGEDGLRAALWLDGLLVGIRVARRR